MKTSKAPLILLVEDNLGDVRLIAEGLRRGTVDHDLHVVEDGDEALAYLRREERFALARRPDLVILDLNLPRKDGGEVLSDIRADHDLHALSVVVLTSSASEVDITRCYELRANAFVSKPTEMEEFMSTLASINNFWLRTARVPEKVSR